MTTILRLADLFRQAQPDRDESAPRPDPDDDGMTMPRTYAQMSPEERFRRGQELQREIIAFLRTHPES